MQPPLRTVRLISPLLFLCLLAACSQAPTSPDFRYAGTWTGFWKDTPAMFISGHPDGSDLTLNVASDGSASAGGSREQTYAEGVRECGMELTLTVMPDGAVRGTGFMHSALSGIFGYSGSGYVVGQLDTRTGIGSGNLIAEVMGATWHFPWRVERE